MEKLLFSKFFKRPIAALKPRRNPEDIAVQNVPTGAILWAGFVAREHVCDAHRAGHRMRRDVHPHCYLSFNLRAIWRPPEDVLYRRADLGRRGRRSEWNMLLVKGRLKAAMVREGLQRRAW